MDVKEAKDGFRCAKCNYKFAVKSSRFEHIKCPWCGDLIR